MADIMAITTGRLSVSRIVFYADLQRAAGLIIPLGVIAEMTLGPARALGIIGRPELSEREIAVLGSMIKEQLHTPYPYLKGEFDLAWNSAIPGRALEMLCNRHTESLFFFPPTTTTIRIALSSPSSQSELADAVKRELTDARDKEFKLMMAELAESAPPNIEETTKFAA